MKSLVVLVVGLVLGAQAYDQDVQIGIVNTAHIPVGCSAALKCTPIEFCTAKGMISNTSVVLSREQQIYRVPITDCRDLETGIIGKCCRDPYYTDPWPTNQIGQWIPGIFDIGKYEGGKIIKGPVRPPTTKAPAIAQKFQIVSGGGAQVAVVEEKQEVQIGTVGIGINEIPGEKKQIIKPGETIVVKKGGGGLLIGGGYGEQVIKGYGTVVTQTLYRIFLQAYSAGAQCGLLRNQRPYGDHISLEADFAQYPWQAMVLEKANQTLRCGGVITRPDVVLTSASCVYGLEPSNILIKGGEWKLGVEEEPLPFQIVQVKHVLYHPFYKHGTYQYDVALLVLDENLRFANNIYPICMPTAEESYEALYAEGGACVVTGWGKEVLQAHRLGSVMHDLNVTLVQPDECSARINKYYPEYLKYFDKDSSACAQPQDPLHNMCSVDIGSALACPTKNGNYVLRGIYSWDSGCRQLGNQIGAFYKFDLEWYQWAIGLIESVRFAQFSKEPLLAGGQEKIKIEAGEKKEIIKPGETIVVKKGGGGLLIGGGYGEQVIKGYGTVVTQTLYRIFLQAYSAGAQCGLLRNQRPYGDHISLEADFAQYPWQAMVLEKANQTLRCGGVITRPDVVLTPASCVYGLEPSNILIKGGEWKLGVEEEPLPFQIVQVKHVLYHPFYKHGTYQYDVALLVLDENLRFANNIYPICMPTAEESYEALYAEGGACVVTGWGKEVLQAHRLGSVMHDLNVTLVQPDECSARINKYYPEYLKYFDKDSSACAQPQDPLHNMCSVDIGSALACPTKNGNYVLRGIYSWDSGCRQLGNQIGAFYKFDLEWYQWAIGLIESVRFAQFSKEPLLAGGQEKIKIEAGEKKEIIKPGETIVVKKGGGGLLIGGGYGEQVIKGYGTVVTQTLYRIFLQAYSAGAQCGLLRNQRPYGDHISLEADFAQYPWQAMVLEKANQTLRCGGVITRPDVVLTPASCVYGLEPSNILIKGGEWKLGVEEEPLPFQIVQVKHVLYHPFYKHGTYQYDVALLVLDENLRFANNIYPICMPTAEESYEALYAEGGACVVTGWGKEVLQAHRLGSVMHDLNVTLVQPDECSARINKYYPEYLKYFDKDSSACTQPQDPLHNMCSVDIGSALACPTKNGNYVLRGIYSWDSGCRQLGNQIGAFYKFDLEWYQWAIGLIESVRFAQFSKEPLLAGGQEKIKIEAGEKKEIIKPGETIVVKKGGGGLLIGGGYGEQVIKGYGTVVTQTLYRIFLQAYSAGAQCGLLRNQRPYGDHISLEADFAQYPWQAMVLEKANQTLRCGGVITRPDVVLTSASCVYGLEPSNILIKGGEWKLGVEEEPLPFQIVQVKHVLYHPFYKHGTYQYDVALLVLDENLRFANNIYPICMPTAEESYEALYAEGGACVVTGWGKEVLQAHRLGSVMHDLNVTLVQPDECSARINKYYPEYLKYFDKDSSACTQPQDPLHNMCSVDIGSALACPTKNGNYVLRGIYSWDSGCRQLGNQIGAFYKFDLEWYQWAIGLIESVRFAQFSKEPLLAGGQEKIKIEAGEKKEIIKPGETIVVKKGGGGLLIGGGYGEQMIKGYGTVVTQTLYRIFLQAYSAGAQCGLLRNQRPYGDHISLEADFAQYPWQAMVLEKANQTLRCGGVITRPDVVLTSASCVYGLEPSNILIKGGEWKLGVEEEPLPFQIVQVKHVLYHPFYEHGTYQYDVALLILDENLRFANNIYPICMPTAEESYEALYAEGGACVVTGWGKEVLQAHRLGSVMHDLNVTLVQPDECSARINKYYPEYLKYFNKDSSACAQPQDPLHNMCSVDIGSALACPTKNGNYVLRGIYSWDSGCRQLGNQIGAFYKFDLEWYQWAIGLIESVRFAQFSKEPLLAGGQEKIKIEGDALGIKQEAVDLGQAGLELLASQGATLVSGQTIIYQSKPEYFTITKPQYFTYTTKPEIFTYTTKPEIFTYTTKPEIFTYTTKPEIFTYTTKPEIFTYTTKPEIISYTTKPEFISYITKPEISRTRLSLS